MQSWPNRNPILVIIRQIVWKIKFIAALRSYSQFQSPNYKLWVKDPFDLWVHEKLTDNVHSKWSTSWISFCHKWREQLHKLSLVLPPTNTQPYPPKCWVRFVTWRRQNTIKSIDGRGIDCWILDRTYFQLTLIALIVFRMLMFCWLFC